MVAGLFAGRVAFVAMSADHLVGFANKAVAFGDAVAKVLLVRFELASLALPTLAALFLRGDDQYLPKG